jgi:PhnB protein
MAEELNERALAATAAMLEGCPSAAFKARLRRSLERSISMTTGTATRVPGARAGFTAVTPYLVAPDVERLIAFVKGVFEAEETHRSVGSAGGTHCELRIGDSMLMLGGGIPGVTHGGPFSPRLMGLHVYVGDADAVFQRAIDAGAESLGAPADRPYGERAGFVRDPAGNHWYIATHQGPTYFAEAPRTVTPNVHVQRTAERGAPEFIDFLKAAFGARVELRHDTPDGMVVHAVLRLRDAAIEIGEAHGAALSAPAGFYLYVDDCDAVHEQALAAGATSLHAPVDQPYGDRMGGVADAWGNEWFIATYLGDR